MSFFVKAAAAGRPASPLAFYASQLAAAMLAAVAVAQLFTYESFPLVLGGYPLPGGSATATLLAALIVTAEVLAVPYLLRMRISPLMRLVSFGLGCISCLIWFVLGSYVLMQDGGTMNSGFLGATLPISTPWLSLLFACGLFAALAISKLVPLRRVGRQR